MPRWKPTSRYRGVTLRPHTTDHFQARVRADGARHSLGIWRTERDAAIARDRAALHFGLDVDLNLPRESRALGPLSPAELRHAAHVAWKESRCASRYFGVLWIRARETWAAEIQLAGRWKIIPCAAGEEQAALIHDRLARHYFGRTAKLNFPKRELRPASIEDIRRELATVRRRTATSRYRGVARPLKSRGGWAASIEVGKLHALGEWRRERDAAIAYDRAALFLIGPSAPRNFPHLKLAPAAPKTLRSEQRTQRKSLRTSRFVGVAWIATTKTWRATVKLGGRAHILGSFDDEEEAARAYDRVMLEKHGKRAKLNFPARTTKPATIDDVRGEKRAEFKQRTTSRYTGVSWRQFTQKWRAQIQVRGVLHELGEFDDDRAAARAYDRAALRLRGPAARLNFARS